MTITNLYQIIADRIAAKSTNSYVAQLVASGDDRVIQKVGEEAVEVVIAAKGSDRQRLISELADLWFHTLVLMAQKGVTFDDLESELSNRHQH